MQHQAVLAPMRARPTLRGMTSAASQQVRIPRLPLLRTLEGLGVIARHLDPIGYTHLLARAAPSHEELRAVRAPCRPGPIPTPPCARCSMWQRPGAGGVSTGCTKPPRRRKTSRAPCAACATFPRALEALYPLAGILPPVNRFFLDPAHRDDADLQKRLLQQPPPPDTGVMLLRRRSGRARRSVGLRARNLRCRHAASGRLRAAWRIRPRARLHVELGAAARTRGAILVAPTSLGQTWAIQGDDPRLAASRQHPRLRPREMDDRSRAASC